MGKIMNARKEVGLEKFSNNFNCAQSVLSAFSDKLMMKEKDLLRVASGFGSGMRKAETCGAVTGAIMAIGLKHGQTKSFDHEAKEKTNVLVHEFQELFQKKSGATSCKDLLGTDISIKENFDKAKDSGLFDSICTKCIADSISILENKFI